VLQQRYRRPTPTPQKPVGTRRRRISDAVIPCPDAENPRLTREKEEEGGREEKRSSSGEGLPAVDPTLYPTLKKILGSRRRRRKIHWDPDAETVGRRYLARL
jgi:hypothetical protein